MESAKSKAPRGGVAAAVGAWVVLGVVAVFYFFVPGFGPMQAQSPLVWLESAWNPATDFEHGFLVPVIMIGLIAWQWKGLRQAAGRGDWKGLPVALFGAALFVLAHRTGQARIAVGGLPFILWGSALYLWGWGVARLALFPIFLLWLAIPLPHFQQATTQLQILSTKLAQIGCGLFGVETVVQGTQIGPPGGGWAPLEIDEGCGGIRSLMALILISCVWAYLAKMPLWKKLILCLSAVPLAIFGNMMRLTSIFVLSEYVNPKFASKTWHDWSGLLIFYPISLAMLLLLHSVLERGLPKMRRLRVRQVSGYNPKAEGST